MVQGHLVSRTERKTQVCKAGESTHLLSVTECHHKISKSLRVVRGHRMLVVTGWSGDTSPCFPIRSKRRASQYLRMVLCGRRHLLHTVRFLHVTQGGSSSSYYHIRTDEAHDGQTAAMQPAGNKGPNIPLSNGSTGDPSEEEVRTNMFVGWVSSCRA